MIDAEALRVLYSDTKDVQQSVLEHAIHKINCRKEELKYVSYDFFDNTTVAILTNKQIVYVQQNNPKYDVKCIRYYDIKTVGYEMLEDRLKIQLLDKHNNTICRLPSSNYNNSKDIVKFIYNQSMQANNRKILNIFKK